MKSLVSFLVLLCLFSGGTFAQEKDKASSLPEYDRINSQVLGLFREGKYDDAQKLSEQELAIVEKTLGADNERIAATLFNLGYIFRAKKRYRESLSSFERALAVYRKAFGEKHERVFVTQSEVGKAFVMSGDKDAAAEAFGKSLQIGEKIYGADSAQIAAQMVQWAGTYEREKYNAEAEIYFIRAIKMNDRVLKDSQKEENERTDVDNFHCFLLTNYGSRNAARKFEAFNKERRALMTGDTQNLSGDIVNGKALRLAAPEYPFEARAVRASGSVMVKVTIDENGDVISAKHICGPVLLAASSVNAARNSKFSKTLIDGKPVKLTGVIVYNFNVR